MSWRLRSPRAKTTLTVQAWFEVEVEDPAADSLALLAVCLLAQHPHPTFSRSLTVPPTDITIPIPSGSAERARRLRD